MLMSMKRLLQVIILPVLLCFSLQLLAQDRVITGKVTDSKDGSAVVGASVQPKGSQTGTSTSSDGTFRLTVPAGVNTLVISSVEFETMEVDITGKSSVDVVMKTAAGGLSEVVVIGYGTSRKKDLTGSVASLQAKDFNKGTYTSPDQLIQGKVTGVQVINNSGQPGGATTVKIRGNSAVFGSGQPLYVVDGIALDGRSVKPGLNAQNIGQTPGSNPLNFINPSDIQSMDILKDASATAIYGSRAAYGVVLITTKRGVSGQPKIDVGSSLGISSIMKRIDVLDAGQYRQALSYYGVSAANDKGSNVNALDEILQKGLVQNHTVSVSGGNENGRYRISLGVLDQEGIIRKSNFRKYTASISANFKFLDSKKLGLDLNILPSHTIDAIPPITNDAGSTGSLIGQALQWNPTEALKKSDGSFNIKDGDIVNPLAMSSAYDDKTRSTTIVASISPYFKFTNWLEYRMLYSVNYNTGNRRASIQQYINLNDVKDKGWASISDNELLTQQFTHTLSFNKKVSQDLNLNAVIGYEYIKFTSKGSSITAYGPNGGGFGAYGLDYTNYIQYSNSSNRSISAFVDPLNELQSLFARATFNYLDKYLLTATIRRDGSTKFGDNKKYGTFPSFAAAWNIDKESFFNVDFFNSLKLRAGWGKTGNSEFPPGSARQRYRFTNNGGLERFTYDNADLQWQEDRQYNVGLDFTILKNRLSGTVDYFNKKTTKLLYPGVADPFGPPGNAIAWKNLQNGEIENKGIEASLNFAIISKTDLTWDFGINATFLKNNVSKLLAPIFTGNLNGQGVSGTQVQTIANGLPINAFFTRDFLGMDKATGLATYREGGSVFYYVGDPNPKTILGITTSVTYKKFSLGINMNGAFGQDIYNNTLNNVINVGSLKGGRNIAVSVFKDPIKEAFANPVTSSSRFIEKGNYLKMANAIISYNVGNVAKVFKGATVYVTGQNLFVITDFKGFDPEVNTDKNQNGIPSVGIEYTPYPSARTITFGVNFSL